MLILTIHDIHVLPQNENVTLEICELDNGLGRVLHKHWSLFEEEDVLPISNLPAIQMNTLPTKVVHKPPYPPVAKRQIVETEI